MTGRDSHLADLRHLRARKCRLSKRPFRKRSKKFRTEGFTAEEVKAQSGWLQSQQVRRAQDNSLAGTLNSYLDLDKTMKWDAELEN